MAVEHVASPSKYAPLIGFSSAVRAGDQVFVTGTTAVDGAGVVVGGEDPYLQAQEALRKIGVALAVVSAELSQVVQTRIYLVRAGDWEAVGRAHGEAFGGAMPAATMVVVAALLDPGMLVEIEAVAYTGS